MMTSRSPNESITKTTGRRVEQFQKKSFAIRFHDLLERIDADDVDSDIVSWMPHGRAFRVHKQQAFVKSIMPTMFRQTKWPSFQRQLHMYSFVRITHGPDKGAYYHPMFLRGQSKLARRMLRSRIKGTKVRAPGNPETEPDFYAMPFVEKEFHQEYTMPISAYNHGALNGSNYSLKCMMNLHDDHNSAGTNDIANHEIGSCQDNFPSIPDDPELLEAMAAALGTPFSIDHLNELPQDEAGWNYLMDQKKDQQQTLPSDFSHPRQVVTI